MGERWAVVLGMGLVGACLGASYPAELPGPCWCGATDFGDARVEVVEVIPRRPAELAACDCDNPTARRELGPLELTLREASGREHRAALYYSDTPGRVVDAGDWVFLRSHLEPGDRSQAWLRLWDDVHGTHLALGRGLTDAAFLPEAVLAPHLAELGRRDFGCLTQVAHAARFSLNEHSLVLAPGRRTRVADGSRAFDVVQHWGYALTSPECPRSAPTFAFSLARRP